MAVKLDYHADHFVVRIEGSAVVTSLKRAIVVPYSVIGTAEARAPEWPPIVVNCFGLYAPRLAASGVFMDWQFRHRRFLHFDRKTSRALVLDLAGHPHYEQIVVDVDDPRRAADELLRRRDAPLK